MWVYDDSRSVGMAGREKSGTIQETSKRVHDKLEWEGMEFRRLSGSEIMECVGDGVRLIVLKRWIAEWRGSRRA